MYIYVYLYIYIYMYIYSCVLWYVYWTSRPSLHDSQEVVGSGIGINLLTNGYVPIWINP